MTSRVWQRLFGGLATGCHQRSWQWFTGGCSQSSPLTISASLLSQAECLASSRQTSPKSAVPSRVQEALPAEGTRGGSLGHEPLRVRSGNHTMFVDALLFLKHPEPR